MIFSKSNCSRLVAAFATGLICLACGNLFAGSREAAEAFQEGLKIAGEKEYRDAAKKFLDAEHLADNYVMRAKAVKEAMLNFRKAKLYWQEFQCIEKLLNSYPDQVEYAKLVDREYELGNLFFEGHRDPAFWSLRWIPWLTEKDRTLDVYLKALEHAPFSPEAPKVMLRVACMYIDDGKIDKSLSMLRNIIKNYPTSEVCKFAYLELGNALFQLAQKGDGDGKYNREAVSVLTDFIKKYPKATEVDWAQKILLKTKDIAAKRLLDLARFYQHIGRTEPAERYLSDVLKKYPDTESVDQSEELLVSIDKEFIPTGFRPELKSRLQKFQEAPIPDEPSPVMVTPRESNGKWLLPIRDLGIGEKNIKIDKLNKK